jgi:uncharacterized RDD family membrane protein YckC
VTQPPDADPYATPAATGPASQNESQYGQSPYGQTPYAAQTPYAQPDYGGAPYGSGELASWGRRFGGRLIDGLVFGVPASIIGYTAGSPGLRTLLDLLGLVILGYLNGATGRTPGKRVVGIRLQRDSDGQLLGGGMGIAREFAHFIDSITLLLGWLWPLWDAKRQTFADKIVGTVAVRV